MHGPVGAFAGSVGPARDFDEAVVEGEIVSQRVLPSLRILAVISEVVHDEFVNFGQGAHLLRVVPDGHGRQRDVRVRRLLIAVAIARRPRHCILSRKCSA